MKMARNFGEQHAILKVLRHANDVIIRMPNKALDDMHYASLRNAQKTNLHVTVKSVVYGRRTNGGMHSKQTLFVCLTTD